MISFNGGKGLSKEKAIIILGAENEMEGVDAEYNWLEQKFGEWEMFDQTLLDDRNRQFDILKIKF